MMPLKVFSQKDLGAILDFKLRFENHLHNALAKDNKTIGLLRNFFTEDNAKYL